MFYYIGRRAIADIINQGGEVMVTRKGQSSYAPVIAQGVSEPSIFVKAGQCLESNGKVLTEEAKMHNNNYDKYNGKVQLYWPS